MPPTHLNDPGRQLDPPAWVEIDIVDESRDFINLVNFGSFEETEEGIALLIAPWLLVCRLSDRELLCSV